MKVSDHNLTILLVEDEAQIRYMLRGFLEELGFEVIEAVNGYEAVKKAELMRPRIILMDLSMPVQDGCEAIKKIRENSSLQKVPIIAMSAHGNLAINLFNSIGDFGKGSIEYLPKPFSVTYLGELVNRLI